MKQLLTLCFLKGLSLSKVLEGELLKISVSGVDTNAQPILSCSGAHYLVGELSELLSFLLSFISASHPIFVSFLYINFSIAGRKDNKKITCRSLERLVRKKLGCLGQMRVIGELVVRPVSFSS